MEIKVQWNGCWFAEKTKKMEEENQRLKRMFADLSLEHQALKDIVQKKL